MTGLENHACCCLMEIFNMWPSRRESHHCDQSMSWMLSNARSTEGDFPQNSTILSVEASSGTHSFPLSSSPPDTGRCPPPSHRHEGELSPFMERASHDHTRPSISTSLPSTESVQERYESTLLRCESVLNFSPLLLKQGYFVQYHERVAMA